jgi:uncharacterized protein YjcR
MNWADLSPKQQMQIEKDYIGGREPAEIAPKYGLNPKQISDQAYRKGWPKPQKKTAKKGSKKKAAPKRR